MLESLRKGAGTWVAKAFIGILVLSFAVWGIADIFGGYGRTALAKVGDTEIAAEAFQEQLRREINALTARLGRPFSVQDARKLGLHNQVLARLIGDAAIDTQARSLGLGVSEKAIAEGIRRVEAFQDSSGNFSKEIFIELLRSNGLNEQSFVYLEKQSNIRRQITSAISSTPTVSQTLLRAANAFVNEQRTVDYFTLPAASIGAVADPEDAEITAYYDSHKPAFTAPEYRKLAVLSVSADDLAETIEIKEEDIKASYEARQSEFSTPERRHIQQISFKTPEDAAAAAAKIRSGTDFMAIAKERGLSNEEIDLGLMTESAMVDKSIAKAAFALARDAVSDPVKGLFSTALVRVIKIEEGSTTPFEKARDKLRGELAREKARDELLDMHDAVEDARAGGSTLAEIAKKQNLKFRQIAAVDKTGKGSDNKPAGDLGQSSEALLAAAFASDVGVENDPIESGDSGFVWFDVTDVTPEKLRPLDEVRKEVVAAWRADKEKTLLLKKADEIVQQAVLAGSLQDLASKVQSSVTTTQAFKRNATITGLSPAAIARTFTLADGGVASAPHSNGKDRIIFKLVKVKEPAFTPGSKVSKAMAGEISPALGNDLVVQYVEGLKRQYGVSVNQRTFATLTGQDS